MIRHERLSADLVSEVLERLLVAVKCIGDVLKDNTCELKNVTQRLAI